MREARAEHDLARALAEAGATNVIPGEAFNVESTSYDAQARTVLVRRSESLLVNAYAAHLGLAHERTSTPVGLTDLYLPASGGGHELVEAKSSTSRRHIREAVGQLLDYAPHCEKVTSLAVLLPERPESSAVGYAHRYGVDVVYRTAEGSFERASAPRDARAAILTLTGHPAVGLAPAMVAPETGPRLPAWQPPATEAVRSAPSGVGARASVANFRRDQGLHK